ncbi:MAG: glycosyltransferase family 39 protein [Gemmobacter sp.]
MTRLAPAALAALFVVLAAAFAAHQSVWVDETTQLTGLAMPFGEQLAWLTGAPRPETGVPPDRMPPLSYWLGGLWAAVFGLSEPAMRLFGIACAAAAVPALWLAGRRVSGAWGGAFAAVAVMLSANALGAASAIRAYPLFLALTAWAALAYLRIALDGVTGGRLAVLGALLVAASYAHFYGLVAAFALFGSLVLLGLGRRGRSGAVVLAGLATGLLAVGVVPFATAAAGVEAPGAAPGLREVAAGAVRLAYRLVAHPVHLGAGGLQIAHLAAVGACGIAALWAARAAGRMLAALVLPLALGFAALAGAALAGPAFDVFAPHYNLWMLPFPGLILALALRGGTVGAVLAAAVAATTLWAAAVLVRHAPLYANGPGDWAAAQLGATGTLVIHDGAGDWAWLYFPLFWRSGGAIVQWHEAPDGTLARIVPGGLAPIADAAGERAGYAAVVLARSFSLDSRALGQIARGRASCADFAAAPMAAGRAARFCALAGTTLVWERP